VRHLEIPRLRSTKHERHAWNGRINHAQYDIDGISRRTISPLRERRAAAAAADLRAGGLPRIVEAGRKHATVYAAAGLRGSTPSTGRSRRLAEINDESFVKMSIADVVDDIDKVHDGSIRHRSSTPFHGRLACTAIRVAHEVGELGLGGSRYAVNVGAKPMNCQSAIWTRPGGRRLPTSIGKCFSGWDECRPKKCLRASSPESPLRVYEATRWSLASTRRNSAPILIVSGARHFDAAETGAALARLYGATYQLEPAHGHNVAAGQGEVGALQRGRDRLVNPQPVRHRSQEQRVEKISLVRVWCSGWRPV